MSPNTTSSEHFHSLSIQETLGVLHSQSGGLTSSDAAQRMERDGRNVLPKARGGGPLSIALRQLTDPLILILIAAGAVSYFLHEQIDAVVIFSAVVINGIIGFSQEYKVSEIISRLRRTMRQGTGVVRDGRIQMIDTGDVVVGDILVLRQGDRVPADARIISETGLRTNEASLTGESMPVEKHIDAIQADTAVSDRTNMVYSGSFIEEGTGQAVVTATGIRTELGRIASLVLRERGSDRTPLQERFRSLSRLLSIIFVITSGALFAFGVLGGRDPLEMFLTAIAVAVAAVPESLPVGVSVVLAVGARRILEKGGLVRKMSAAETLGGVTVIATDKTATLTEGRMRVSQFVMTEGREIPKERFVADNGQDSELLRRLTLVTNAYVENPSEEPAQRRLAGSPVEKAILLMALDAGLDLGDMQRDFPRIDEIPFQARYKYSAVLNRMQGRVSLTVLGAPEVLLRAAHLDETAEHRMNERVRLLASQGLRVLALATKDMPEDSSGIARTDVEGLSFWGLIVFTDPIRADVPDAVRDAQKAGTRLVMVTGDHVLTAEYIAKEVGILRGPGRVIEGKNLPGDLSLIVDRYDVFARVSPEDKVRIVDAFQTRRQRIAMIGDGVNDAPALLRADIGVAVGSGTDVAKDASDLVLLNDSFSIIVRAIREGRILFGNILKVALFLLSSSFSEIIIIAGSILSGLPLALLPAQILWVNIIVDGLPAIALAFDKEGSEEAARSPERNLEITSPRFWALISLFSLITDGALFLLYIVLLDGGDSVIHARTMIFTALGITALLYVYSVRSLDRPVWRTNPFGNVFLNVSVFIGFMLYASSLYLPVLNGLLRTVPLSSGDWLVVGGLGVFNIVVFELGKYLFITRNNHHRSA